MNAYVDRNGMVAVPGLLTLLVAWGACHKPTIRPPMSSAQPPEPGMLHAGSKGVAMNKLTYCVAAAVAGLGGASAADKQGRWRRARVKWEMSVQARCRLNSVTPRAVSGCGPSAAIRFAPVSSPYPNGRIQEKDPHES